MIKITSIHLEGGSEHKHIAAVRWKNSNTLETGESTRAAMVRWIRDEGGVAKVHGSDGSVSTVGVVNASPPYLRTHADGSWNDNLLALPEY